MVFDVPSGRIKREWTITNDCLSPLIIKFKRLLKHLQPSDKHNCKTHYLFDYNSKNINVISLPNKVNEEKHLNSPLRL